MARALVLATALALSFTHAALAAPPAPAAPPTALDMAKHARDVYSRYLAQAGPCRWGSPTARTILYGEMAMWRDLAVAAGPPGTEVVQPDYSVKQQPCGSEADRKAQNDAAFSFWEWTTRLRIMAQLGAAPGWGNGLIAIPTASFGQTDGRRADIEKALIAANGQEAMQQRFAALQQESIVVFNLVCEPRKTTGKAVSRACPALPPGLLKDRPAAEVRAGMAEFVAGQLVGDALNEQRGAIGQGYQLKTAFLDIDVKCKPGNYVVYPEAADTTVAGDVIDVAIRRYAQTGDFGRAKLRSSGGDFEIVELPENNIVDPDVYIIPTFDLCLDP